MKLQLINVGRMKVNKTVTVKNEREIWNEVSRHLLSREVEIIETDTPNKYTVHAGCRPVGEIIVTED